MNPEAEAGYLVVLACSPALILGVHVILSRILPRGGTLSAARQLVAVGAVLGGMPPAAFAAWRRALGTAAWGPDLGWAVVYGVVTYFSIGYAYFHLFNLSETARRLRILYVLHENGPTSRASLERRYTPRGMLAVRLDRLAAVGQLKLAGGRYRLGGRLLWAAAAACDAWRKALGFDPGP